MADLITVTLRLPTALVATIDAEARARARHLDMSVNRTDVVRSVLTNHFREKEGACTAPKTQTPK